MRWVVIHASLEAVVAAAVSGGSSDAEKTKLPEVRCESTPARKITIPLAVIQMWRNVPFRMLPALPSIAARLCSQCGMCCNGVMFHRVRLQPADSPKELAALGLKLKRKRGQHYLLQPCPAFRETHCSIYMSRPQRCRLFECRQLQRVNAGEITEAMALEKIREVKGRVGQVSDLLDQVDETTDAKKPLMKRCENVLAEPLEPAADDEAREFQRRLTLAMQELDKMLDEEFRIDQPKD
jgi:Fe-S-cluster containining protein